MRVLITGATGCVGRALVRAVRAEGWTVRGLARRPPTEDWRGEELVAGLVEDREVVRRAADGCQAIVHLASWVHRVPQSPADLLELRRSIVDGTRHVAEAARDGGAPLLLASTVAVYGSRHTTAVDESSPVSPETPYAQAKLESESLARSILPNVAILRIALVYGPHDRGNFVTLIRAVDRLRAFTVGSGRNRKSLIYVDNLADRIVLCLKDASPRTSGVWIAADGPAPTQRELMRLVARALHRPTPPRLPRAFLEAGSHLADSVSALVGRPSDLRDKVRKLAAPTELSGAALDNLLGYRPRIPLPEGIDRAVSWYRASLKTQP